jgi:hypothetical protein
MEGNHITHKDIESEMSADRISEVLIQHGASPVPRHTLARRMVIIGTGLIGSPGLSTRFAFSLRSQSAWRL